MTATIARQFLRPNSEWGRSLLRAGSLAILLLAWGAEQTIAQSDDDWQDRVIYFALLDRFENGDPANDKAHGDPECNNAGDAHAYQGGDLAGLKQRIESIAKLGANAIWITPLYKGVPQKVGDNCGFPGYWAAFSDPYVFELDPRFGTPEEFDEVLASAHSRDIKVILDMVVNHAG